MKRSVWAIAVLASACGGATIMAIRRARGDVVVKSERGHHASELETLQASARLREGHRLLLMAEAAAGIGHWRLDTADNTLFWSDEVYRIYGVNPTSLPNLDAAIGAYHPDDRDMVAAVIGRALDTLEPFDFRARIVRGDGSIRHVTSRGQVECAPDGKPVGLFGVFQDITEQHVAEAELVAARDAARAAADAKSTFLAMMSHEIRTPLTGVIGMIELLRLDPLSPERDRLFKSLDHSAQMLMTVINDVLDYSKIESQNLMLEAIPFDLATLAQRSVDLFHDAASQKGVQLALTLPSDDDLMVRGDPVRVQQIITNLIGNAIKFTAHGRIDLTVSESANGAGNEGVTIVVRDTGIGIAEPSVPDLFLPFVQADVSTTRQFGGTGLGLAICHRLVSAMGGSIDVQSVPGVGTAFTVTLPIARCDREELALSAVPALRHDRPPLRVLVAEDNTVNQLLITGLLRHAGHHPTCVANGRLAVEAARAHGFDVVLMDMQMPELDGLEATRLIRALPGAAGTVPILALTADASAERRSLYRDSGLSGFLAKPVDSQRLAAELARLTAPGPDAQPIIPPPISCEDMDPERLAAIERVFGREQRDRLLRLLCDDISQRMGAIDGLILGCDLRDLQRSGHALAGAAANVGATALASAARQLETAEDLDAARRASVDLKHVAARTIAEIDRFCAAQAESRRAA